MSLKDLNSKLKHKYNSDKDNILEDFYIPVLKESSNYYRLAGFFSSSALVAAAKGIKGFLENDGKMKLLCSAQLSPSDKKTLEEAASQPEEVIEKIGIKTVDEIDDKFLKNNLKVLAWMISKNILEIKIVLVRGRNGRILTAEEVEKCGIFHPKVGIMGDEEGNMISFAGSNNESLMAWKENIDRFKVCRNWGEDFEKESFKEDLDDFFYFWNGDTQRCEVYSLPEAVRKNFLKNAPKDKYELNETLIEIDEQIKEWNVLKSTNKKIITNIPRLPDFIKLRNYQYNPEGNAEDSAITAWLESGRKGIWDMATGTGKTITALSLVTKLYELNKKKLAVIIACPYKHLVKQWQKTAKDFNLDPFLAFESRELWENPLNSKITSFNMGVVDCFTVISTHKTFGTNLMLDSLSKINSDAILIIDEVHHFGAKNLSQYLPKNIEWRLGLSATPKDWYDDTRNERILEYFSDDVIFSYSLEMAIKEGYLSKYYYYPHLVELTEKESEEYYDLSKKIAKIFSKLDEDIELSDNQMLQNLLFKRARLIGTAENKLSTLKELFEDKKDSEFNLVYCGDGKIEDERQIEKVIKILGGDLGIKVHPFTAEEDTNIRQNLLKRFKNGDLQALIAIRCLDEGVDVPATQTAFILASTTNPRQFIQRRGRILRVDENKDYSYIYDLITIPPTMSKTCSLDANQFNIERKLVERELRRVVHFAKNAENGPQANRKLLELKKKYNLMNI